MELCPGKMGPHPLALWLADLPSALLPVLVGGSLHPPSQGEGTRAAGDTTFREREGSFCLKRKSQTSRVPSDLVVKKTAGLTVLQQPSVR